VGLSGPTSFNRPDQSIFIQKLMTERLYYTDSFLYEFDARVVEVRPPTALEPRTALVLDRTAFYPTSGGQVFDTGWIASTTPAASNYKWQVAEVSEDEEGTVKHFLQNADSLTAGIEVHGTIDGDRRRDHIQQHSGQHVLSAAFIQLFNLPTLSFHMGDGYCSIDLQASQLSPEQVESAERLANEVILEDRPVSIRFVSQEEARSLGLRKIPPAEKEKLRLIDIRDFDLTACGGTHVRATGQIGSILLRKTEKVRQGIRVEFVCGQRAVKTARRDYTTLSESAGLLSAHIWDLPQQVGKSLEETRNARKYGQQLLEDLAEQYAVRMLEGATKSDGFVLVLKVFPDRDLNFIRLLGQRLTRLDAKVVALLGATSNQPSLVFAQSPGQPLDMDRLMKEAVATLGGRGGGSKDLAQGGLPDGNKVQILLEETATKVLSSA